MNNYDLKKVSPQTIFLLVTDFFCINSDKDDLTTSVFSAICGNCSGLFTFWCRQRVGSK